MYGLNSLYLSVAQRLNPVFTLLLSAKYCQAQHARRKMTYNVHSALLYVLIYISYSVSTCLQPAAVLCKLYIHDNV